MAVVFGLAVPSARPTRDDDVLTPVGEVVALLESMRADAIGEEDAHLAREPARPTDVQHRLEVAFGMPLPVPDLSLAGLRLSSARVAGPDAAMPTALLGFSRGRAAACVWIGWSEDVGQFATSDLYGQLEPLSLERIVGDVGSVGEATVYVWRRDGLLWVIMGDDAALLTQVLAGASAPTQAVEP